MGAVAIHNPIARILRTQPVVVLDGALATELERRGCDLPDPLWSARVLLEAPAVIRQVHEEYFAAGADCAITASYQATFQGFARCGLDVDDAANLMRLSVQLAVEARDACWANPRNRVGRARPFVAASVGPYGAFLHDGSEYRGDYGLSEAELMAFHRPRLAVLAAAGADMLACETIPCLVEARALARLLEEFPGVSAWFSFTARDSTHISAGETLAACAQWLDRYPQVAAIGVNCTAPQFVPGLVRSVAEVTRKPILAYPNSGESYDAACANWQGTVNREGFGTLAQQWYDSGARVIGGCCRTTPDDIRAVVTQLRSGAGK